jgi:hypothetical protein
VAGADPPIMLRGSKTKELIPLLADWFMKCKALYKSCNEKKIRCHTGGKGRVRESAQLDTCPPYATLSHSWGSYGLPRLLEENTGQFHEDIPMQVLSETFKHAIQIIRQLKFDYIWIDSLCIVQDSA